MDFNTLSKFFISLRREQNTLQFVSLIRDAIDPNARLASLINDASGYLYDFDVSFLSS